MNERPRSESCLDRRTLETLAAGRCPIDRVEQLRTHLPRCSKCRAAIVASTNRRPRGGDTLLLAPGQWQRPEQPQLALRAGLVVVALLSVGIAVWFTTAGAHVRERLGRSLRPDGTGTPSMAASTSLRAPLPSTSTASPPATEPSPGAGAALLPTAPHPSAPGVR